MTRNDTSITMASQAPHPASAAMRPRTAANRREPAAQVDNVTDSEFHSLTEYLMKNTKDMERAARAGRAPRDPRRPHPSLG